ncbi:hypothetical protein [Streptomyces sp. NPDC047028]|uniref:hypothetical protein n=1 Tax=Streptomyces sp. NPDC047028 TaxID=3155793 RepID=UPI0033C0D72E
MALFLFKRRKPSMSRTTLFPRQPRSDSTPGKSSSNRWEQLHAWREALIGSTSPLSSATEAPEVSAVTSWRLLPRRFRVAFLAGSFLGVALCSWWCLNTLTQWLAERVGLSDGTGLLTTVVAPVHRYLRVHTAELAVGDGLAYGLWELSGTVSFLVSWWCMSVGARITWTAWGVSTVLMVFEASPASGRGVAGALAALIWSALSTFALRGLSLRPQACVHVHNAPTPSSGRQTDKGKAAMTPVTVTVSERDVRRGG